MIFVHEISQELFFDTPKGKAKVFALIYRGSEANLKWICFMQETGEIWEYSNPEIRCEKNITMGRRVNENESPKSFPCLECHGFGAVGDPDKLVVCVKCNGKGRVFI